MPHPGTSEQAAAPAVALLHGGDGSGRGGLGASLSRGARQPGIIENRDGLAWLYATLGFDTSYAFLQFLGLAVFITVMTSIAVRAFTFYLVTRFSRGVATALGIPLLRQYLARSFEWFWRSIPPISADRS